MLKELIVHQGSEVHVRIYDTVIELLDAVSIGSTRQLPAKGSYIARWTGAGFDNWKEVEQKVLSAWEEGMRQLDDTLSNINHQHKLPKPKTRRRVPRWNDMDGDEIDNDRLRSGQSFWRKSQREATAGPTTLTVISDIGTRAKHETQDIFWRGAASVILTKLLEEAGYRVELWGASYATKERGRPNVFTACCLKKSSEPLNIGSILSALAGWFFRTVIFASRELDSLGVGGSHPISQQPQLLDMLTLDKTRVIVDELWSESAVIKFVTDTVLEFQEGEQRT